MSKNKALSKNIYLIPLFDVGEPSCWTFGRGHPGDNPGLEPWSILLWAGW